MAQEISVALIALRGLEHARTKYGEPFATKATHDVAIVHNCTFPVAPDGVEQLTRNQKALATDRQPKQPGARASKKFDKARGHSFVVQLKAEGTRGRRAFA